MKDLVDRFDLTNSCWQGITTDNASSNYSTSCGLQWTHEASGIERPALRNHIPCVAHIIKLALGAFMSSLGVKGRTKSWEAHERNLQFGGNESIGIGKSQRLWKEGNAPINKVSAMRRGLAMIIECHGSGYQWWVGRYFRMVSSVQKELLLRKGGDVDWRVDGVGMLYDGGGIVCSDKEVVWGVAMSADVAWWYWYGIVLMVWKIIEGYSDDTLENKR